MVRLGFSVILLGVPCRPQVLNWVSMVFHWPPLMFSWRALLFSPALAQRRFMNVFGCICLFIIFCVLDVLWLFIACFWAFNAFP